MKANAIAGKTILFTRPGGISEQLKKTVTDAGGRALHLPCLEIKALTDTKQLGEIPAAVTASSVLIFLSRNAVKYALELMPDLPARVGKRTIIAIGSGTREALQNAGLRDVLVAEGNRGSEALLELKELQQQNVAGGNVLILRGQGGRELLREKLITRGAEIQYAELYCRARPLISAEIVSNIWRMEKPDAVTVSSAEGLTNLLAMTDTKDQPVFLHTPLVVVSQRLEKFAGSLGFNAAIKVTMGYSDDDFLQALTELFEAGN